MIIEDPKINDRGKYFRVTTTVNNDLIWFELDKKYKKLVSGNKGLINSFLLASLPNAMLLGEDIHLKGQASERLIYQINNHLIPLLCYYKSSWKSIKVIPEAGFSPTSKEPLPENAGAATGFSGGVDSFFTICKNIDTSTSFRLRHLLLINAYDDRQNEMFDSYREIQREGAREIGINYIEIDSNMNSLMMNSYYTTHSIMTIAAVHLLSGLITSYYYASATNFSNTFKEIVRRPGNIAYLDLLVLPLLSSETVSVLSYGSEYTRMERVCVISQYEPSYNNLNVCMSPTSKLNCGLCGKCTRTIFSLYVSGALHKYKNVFDVDRWLIKKNKHIAFALMHDSYFLKEIIDYADDNNVYLAPLWKRTFFVLIRQFLKFGFVKRFRKLITKKIYRGKLRE